MIKEKKPKIVNHSFEIDSEHTTEMPTIDRLLNRKSLIIPGLEVQGVDITKTQLSQFTIKPEPTVQTKSLLTTSTKGPKVQRAMRRSKTPKEKLSAWDPELLRQSNDPMSQILADLIAPEKGVTESLFLSTVMDGSTLQFHARAAQAPKAKFKLWAGLRWNPQSAPEIWDRLTKDGFFEMKPNDGNLIRSAFGISPDDFALIVEIGPLSACRGIAVIVSSISLSPILKKNLSTFVTEQQAA